MKNVIVIGLALSVLAGCTSSSGSSGALIPNKAIKLTAHTAIPLSSLATAAAVGAAVYLIYDPLAPNWEIEESRLADDTYQMSLTMKRFHTGGAGESIQILKRRAAQLQRERGFASYQIVEYSEGIDSQTLGARRVAEGVVRLVSRQQADSFLLN